MSPASGSLYKKSALVWGESDDKTSHPAAKTISTPASTTTPRYIPPAMRGGPPVPLAHAPRPSPGGLRNRIHNPKWSHPVPPSSAVQGRRPYQQQWSTKSKPEPAPFLPSEAALKEAMQGLGDAVARIDVAPAKVPRAVFANVRSAGGYRWLTLAEGEVPVMVVPGVPDVLTDRKVGKVVPDSKIPGNLQGQDLSGMMLRLQGVSPLEPLFHAISDAAHLRDLDIVITRNALSKLVRMTGLETIYHDQWLFPARFDCELIGNTVVVHSWEPIDKLEVGPCDDWNSSRSYHLAATRPTARGLDINADAEQMVRYNFGGLECLVRFEVQAMAGGDLIDMADDFDDDCADGDEPVSSPDMSLRVRRSARDHADRADLVMVKTRKYGKELDWGVAYSQLAFSQIPTLRVAWHSGLDYSQHPAETYTLAHPKLAELAEKHQPNMDAVAHMLRQMVEVVRDKGDVSFVAKFPGNLAGHVRLAGLVPLSGEASDMLEFA